MVQIVDILALLNNFQISLKSGLVEDSWIPINASFPICCYVLSIRMSKEKLP